jgi:3',5'-cyclic-AMP phosphodiesterase
MLLAQITDLHIRPEGQLVYRRVDTAGHLTRAVAHLNAVSPRPDVVLITGDLVDAGKPQAYAYLRELLKPLAIPYFIIPGNHDNSQFLRQAFADHHYLRQNRAFLHYVVDDFPLRLIGLDSTVPGEDGGRLCHSRLTWLAAALAAAPSRATLLFVHHPPFDTGLRFMDGYKCEGGAELGRLLQRHPQVVGLLCGHLHRTIQRQWCGIPAVIAPSPAYAFQLELAGRGDLTALLEPPACLLHSWEADEGLVSHVSFVGAFSEVFHHDPGHDGAA